MLVLLHLFALFLLVLLGFYVFVANPRNCAHRTFAAFIAFLAFWTIKDLIFWNFHDETIANAQERYNANPTPKNLERLNRAQMDKQNSIRDDEVLIKGVVPREYIKTKP